MVARHRPRKDALAQARRRSLHTVSIAAASNDLIQ
jgi:hypothetical protein